MESTTEKKAWNLTEEEFEAKRIPFRHKKGVYTSLNGKYSIEFKSDKKAGSAGLAYTYIFYVNGKKVNATFNYAQKLMFELPEDYSYWITPELVKEYARENGLN